MWIIIGKLLSVKFGAHNFNHNSNFSWPYFWYLGEKNISIRIRLYTRYSQLIWTFYHYTSNLQWIVYKDKPPTFTELHREIKNTSRIVSRTSSWSLFYHITTVLGLWLVKKGFRRGIFENDLLERSFLNYLRTVSRIWKQRYYLI